MVSDMKSVLITGVSSGIGYAMTKYLLSKGYFVFGNLRNEGNAKRLKKLFGNNFHPLIFDVCNYSDIERSKNEVAAKLQGTGLSALINNAGIVKEGPLKYLKIDDLEQQFRVNVFGLLKVIQVFLPFLGGELKTAYKAGIIINISSISGLLTLPFVGAYSASKYAVESITDALRRELDIYGINVVSVNPGAVKTPILEKLKNKENAFSGTDYAGFDKYHEKQIRFNDMNGIEPIIVAKRVYQIIEKRKTNLNHVLMKKKLFFLFLFFLPKKIQDIFIYKFRNITVNRN